MADKVPFLSLVFMISTLVISFALPLGLLLYFKIKKNADLPPFFAGCAVMLLFAFVLERLCHQLILYKSPVGETILNSTWLFALYGGLMAGLFEETGRFLAFKTVLKKRNFKDVNALMYGAGHGGFEAIVLVGMTMINNLIYSVLINLGQAEMLTGQVTGDILTQVENAIQTLITTPSSQFLLSGCERIFAIVLHIALSVLVWFAAKKAGKAWLYPLAVFIHFFVDAATVVMSGYGMPVIGLEAVIGLLAVVAAIIAKAVWKKNAVSDEAGATPPGSDANTAETAV